MLKEVFVESLYVFLFFLAPFVICSRITQIKEMHHQKRTERKRELAKREAEYNCKMIYKLFEAEKKRDNRQSITVKGVLAAEYYQKQNMQKGCESNVL